jgi:hypothetical protein
MLFGVKRSSVIDSLTEVQSLAVRFVGTTTDIDHTQTHAHNCTAIMMSLILIDLSADGATPAAEVPKQCHA